MESFPSGLHLWRGAILATIAWAVWVVRHPFFAGELSWDGPNYLVNNSMGTFGTVTFQGNRVVAAFFDVHSARNPLGSAETSYALTPFFRGMPPELRALAHEQTLRYRFEEYNGATPIITAAFWSDGDFLTAAEPWSQVIAHGAHILRKELMETDDAIVAWREECAFSSVQIELVRSLFARRMSALDAPLVLGAKEQAILVADGDEGVDDCRDLLAAVGIILP